MAYVNVPNDLSKVKTKMAFNLTKRQLLCFGAAAIIGYTDLPFHPLRYRRSGGNAPNDCPYAPLLFLRYV